jgi:hypothetical protein
MRNRIRRAAAIATSVAVAAACAGDARADSDERRPRKAGGFEKGSEWVWMNGQIGYEAIDLHTFEADSDLLTAGIVRRTAGGPAADVGLGARLGFVTLGARGRVASFEDDSPGRSVGSWQLWSLDGELGIKIPLGRAEPYLTFAGGYSSLGDLDDAVRGLGRGLDVTGANGRFGLGLDYYVTPRFSVGGSVNGEILALTRSEIPLRDLTEAKRVGTLNEAQARVLEAKGTSWGSALTVAGGAGVHF